MAFAIDSHPRSLAAINITPLVDVMLVLLVIFMMSAPLLTRAITLQLPQAAPPDQAPPLQIEPVQLRIDAAGALRWDGRAIAPAELPALLEAVAARPLAEQPMLQVDADDGSDYQALAAVLAEANGAGVRKVGLVRH